MGGYERRDEWQQQQQHEKAKVGVLVSSPGVWRHQSLLSGINGIIDHCCLGSGDSTLFVLCPPTAPPPPHDTTVSHALGPSPDPHSCLRALAPTSNSSCLPRDV